MTWVLWTLVPMVHTPRGQSGATFVKVLAQSEYGQFVSDRIIPQPQRAMKNCTIPSLVTQIVIPFVRVMSYLHNEIITHNAFYNTISVKHALNVVTNLGDYAHARDL